MKKWHIIGLSLCLLPACVGQKDDPEEYYDPGTDPAGIEVSADQGTRPFHRVLALEFTATWCQYCPNMAAALVQAQTARPGRIIDIAVHQYDEISPAEADDLVQRFKASAFPQLVFDGDGSTLFNEQSSRRMTDYVDATVGAPTCNLAAACFFAGGRLQTLITVKADEAASYNLAVAVVQDRVVVNQLGYGPGYACQSVLRGFLGSGWEGTSLGMLEPATDKTLTFLAEIDLEGAPEADFRVVAFVRKNGRVVNAVTCPLNGKIDYRYEKDNA